MWRRAEVWLLFGNQVRDRCQSYLPPGPQVSFGLSLSSVSADNVLHTTISFNIHQLALHTAVSQAGCVTIWEVLETVSGLFIYIYRS